MKFCHKKSANIFFIFYVLSYSVLSFAEIPWEGKDLEGKICLGSGFGYGPYDYKVASSHRITIVTGAHFTPDVARLKKSKTGSIVGDIDYTLRALPNYHPALYSLIQLYFQDPKRYKRWYRSKKVPPPECYLKRAIRYKSSEYETYSLYGFYLHKRKKYKLAEKQYLEGFKKNRRSTEARYNYALMLIELKRYEDARKQAKLAYKYGYPLQGLKRKLKKLGYSL